MDNKLKCDATTCVHNFNHLCGASTIQVKGGNTTDGNNTFCSTYAIKSTGNYISELGNVNLTGSVSQLFSDNQVMEPKITCNAINCKYNSNEICTAGELKIMGPSSSAPQQTECKTFHP